MQRSGDDRDADDEQEQSDFWYAEPDGCASVRGACTADECRSIANGDAYAQSQSHGASEQSKRASDLLLFSVGAQNMMSNRLFKTGRRCCTHDVPRLRFPRNPCSHTGCSSSSVTSPLASALTCAGNSPAPRSIFGTQLSQFETQWRNTRLSELSLAPEHVVPKQAQLRSHSSAGLTSQSSFEHVDNASKRRRNDDGSEPSTYHHDTSSNADNSPSPSHLVLRTSMEL